MAISYFNMQPNIFWNLCPREFDESLVIYGKSIESSYQQSMEVMRLQTLYLINIHLQRKDQVRSVESLIPFTWDSNKIEIRPFYDDEAEKYKGRIR